MLGSQQDCNQWAFGSTLGVYELSLGVRGLTRVGGRGLRTLLMYEVHPRRGEGAEVGRGEGGCTPLHINILCGND